MQWVTQWTHDYNISPCFACYKHLVLDLIVILVFCVNLNTAINRDTNSLSYQCICKCFWVIKLNKLHFQQTSWFRVPSCSVIKPSELAPRKPYAELTKKSHNLWQQHLHHYSLSLWYIHWQCCCNMVAAPIHTSWASTACFLYKTIPCDNFMT